MLWCIIYVDDFMMDIPKREKMMWILLMSSISLLGVGTATEEATGMQAFWFHYDNNEYFTV